MNATISQLVGWGISIAIASTGAFVGLAANTNNQVAAVKDLFTAADTQIVQRMSVVETQSTQFEKDIERINSKLDDIGGALGVRFKIK